MSNNVATVQIHWPDGKWEDDDGTEREYLVRCLRDLADIIEKGRMPRPSGELYTYTNLLGRMYATIQVAKGEHNG